MLNNIEIGGSLIPGLSDTPLDARGRVAALSGVPDIENPFVGMLFYCLADGETYVVTALKSKVIGAITVPDAQIDTYHPLAVIPETATGNGGEFFYFTIPSGAETDILSLEIELSDSDAFFGVVKFTHANCQVFNPATGEWVDGPSAGYGVAFFRSLARLPRSGETGFRNGRYRYKAPNGVYSTYKSLEV